MVKKRSPMKMAEGKIVSANKAKKELEWEPKIDIEEGIRRYIEWYKMAHRS